MLCVSKLQDGNNYSTNILFSSDASGIDDTHP